jgi:hypothetical protein
MVCDRSLCSLVIMTDSDLPLQERRSAYRQRKWTYMFLSVADTFAMLRAVHLESDIDLSRPGSMLDRSNLRRWLVLVH